MARFIDQLERGVRPTLLGLGDSLTFGYMVPQGYLHIVRDILTEMAPKSPPIVENQGSCGDTAAGGRARLRHLLGDEGPDLALIQFGINDAFLGVEQSAFHENIESLITTFKESRPDGEVLVVPAPPLAWPADDAYVEPFRRAAADVAADHEVLLAPVSDFFHKDHPGAYLADGVHPSPRGHAWMAQAVLAALGVD